MAERTTAKTKRVVAPKGPRKTVSRRSVPVGEHDSELANENQRLKAELAAARERIADLELRQTDVTNRIAWVIDSLHNLDD